MDNEAILEQSAPCEAEALLRLRHFICHADWGRLNPVVDTKDHLTQPWLTQIVASSDTPPRQWFKPCAGHTEVDSTMSAIRNDYVSVKVTPETHTKMQEEARRRYGSPDAISWSALIGQLVDEANEEDILKV